MRFLSSVGTKQTATQAAAVARSSALPNWYHGKPYTPATRPGRRAIQDGHGFDYVTWVYKAVHAVATNAARLQVRVRRDDPIEGANIPRHPILPILNYRSSPHTGEQSFVTRYRISALLELSTNGVFIEKGFNNAGELDSFFLLPSQFTKPIPDPRKFVSGYEVRIGSDVNVIPADRVIWIKNPHPFDPYRSMTPYEAAGIAIDTDWLAHVYNLNFLRNDGRPGGLIAVKGGLEDDSADELRSYFQGGGRAGEWRVIEADALDVQDMAVNPRDAQYIEMRGLSKEEILIAGGVPESVAGNASGRTFDNADAEKETFWQEKMLGHLELLGGAYDLADDDPNTFVVHDTSNVPALQRSAIARRAEMRAEMDRGTRTIDEYRRDNGEEPFGVPETQVPYISAGQIPVYSVNGAGARVEPAPPPPLPVPGGSNGDGQGSSEGGSADTLGEAAGRTAPEGTKAGSPPFA